MDEGKKEKKSERSEEKGIRAYFVHLFGKYDFKNEKQFISFGKWLIFACLIMVEALLLLQQIDGFSERGGWRSLMALIVLESSLTSSGLLKLFVLKKGKTRHVFHIIDMFLACGFLFFTSGRYSSMVYMLILTEVYLSSERTLPAVWLFFISVPLYAICYGLQVHFRMGGAIDFFQLFREVFGVVSALSVHFLSVQIALAFYRQFLRLDKTLQELDESKKELEKAYAVVAEVTALEERQRIAKEIHDTAGHSITTVIMQTEAAKRILDGNPAEAKSKLIAANLQARHALEELRDSVHLLSGSSANKTLKTALEEIIHESTDGTGIKIRSEIEEMSVSSAKYRFLCNSLKEGISNGLRHGGATAFWVELKREGDKIHFLLSDNGVGVGEKGLSLGFGLSGMKERAKSLGGEVTFDFPDGEGFELRIELPVDVE